MADDKIVSIVGQGAIDELKELSRLLEQNVDLVVEFNNATKAGQLKIAGAESLTELNKSIEQAATGLNMLSQSSATLKRATQERAKVDKEAEKALAQARKEAEQTKKELDALARQYEKMQKQAAARAAKAEDKKRMQEEAAAARQFRKELAELEKQQKKSEAEARKMASAYGQLNAQHKEALKNARDLGAALGHESAEFKEAADKANLLDQQLKKIDANLGQHQRNVGNYASAYNGLGVSLGYIASELPNLSQGFGLFLRAIGNNIPQLINDIKTLRQENAKLVASGQQGVSIWKQVGSAIFSWQTAILAVTAIVISQGDKFLNWLTGVSKLSEQSATHIKEMTAALDELQDTQDLQDTRLSNTVKISLARAEAEGASEEEKTKILKDEVQKRIDNQEAYNKELEKLQESQLRVFENANKAAADASFLTSKAKVEIADNELKQLREINAKVAKGKIDLENLKANLEVETYNLQSELRKRNEREQGKADRAAERRLAKLAALNEAIGAARLSFRTKPGMGELEAAAQGLGGTASPIPDILDNAQAKERRKQLLQLESDYYDSLSGIENTHFKTKLEKEQALTQAQIKYAQDRYQIERRALDEQMALLPADSEERLQFLAQANAKELELYQTLNEAKVKDDERAAATRKAIEEKLQDTVLQMWTMAAQAYAQFAQIRANNTIEQIDREIEHNEIAATREIERIKADNTIIDKQKAIQEVEAKTATQRLALEEKQKQARQRAAIAEKAATISQLTLATALAVMRALGDKEIPYPLRVVNAIAAGVVGASQIAIAAATPLPQYAEGTQHHRGGAFIAGEAGERELVVRPDNKSYWTDKVAGIYNEPKGTRVIPESKLYSMPALGGGVAMQKKGDTINIFDDKRIVRAINNNKPVVNINVSNGSKVKHWTA